MTIPYGRQDITQEDIDAVVAVLRSDFLTQGPAVPQLEAALVAHSQAGHAVVVSNATAGLHIACLALGVGPGDLVWTSAITFVASSNGALYCGADVDFVDIDPRSYNMSVEALETKLSEADRNGRLPKVVIPVHLCGQSCDMAAIRALADRYGFGIIEDASHAIGAEYRGEPVGSCRFSDITIFSFHPVKIITTAEGGAVLCNDSAIAARLRLLRSHGITNDAAFMDARPDEEIWNYQQVDLGFNYRMTDLQAALGVSQIGRLGQYIDGRRALAEYYDRAFSNLPLVSPWQHPDGRSSYHLYPILVNETGPSQKDVYSALRKNGIAANLHYIPVYLQPYYEKLGFRRGHCPNAEAYFRRTITLPMFPTITDDQRSHVVKTVSDIVLDVA